MTDGYFQGILSSVSDLQFNEARFRNINGTHKSCYLDGHLNESENGFHIQKECRYLSILILFIFVITKICFYLVSYCLHLFERTIDLGTFLIGAV